MSRTKTEFKPTKFKKMNCNSREGKPDIYYFLHC